MKAAQKRIVITGVSRGLGRALAEGFIRAGHAVVGCARSQDSIVELGQRFPRPHRFDVVDVVDDQQVRAWADEVLSEAAAPELLINNAGIINRNAPLWEVPAEEFSQVIDVNVKGVASVIRHFAPAMIKRRTGVIVNITSGWGRSVSPQVAPYCASKFAVEGLTLALAEELPHGMAAIPLNPGCINTEMLQSCFGDSAFSYPTPEQWAETAVPFIVNLGPEENGQQLTVAS